jgi:cytochrome c oxidase cbb3-type subunit 3
MRRYLFISILAVTVVTGACKREERAFQQPETGTGNEQNAYAVSEGKRLFSAYNCQGCHSMGGGGMGPALMDEVWLYGGKPEDIVSTIVGGRPNGMPSFRDRIPEPQVWQLAAYVRSMGGGLRKDTAPVRDDHMQGRPPESMTKRKQP